MVRDLDIAAPDPRDGRRLEFAVDTTLVSPLHCDGTPTPGAADSDGAALARARRRKERTYPELVQPGEVPGRWSEETRRFIGLLARARARNETKFMRRRVEQGVEAQVVDDVVLRCSESFCCIFVGHEVQSRF